jgi:antimicrobial peptide system SdpA family protein
MKRIPSLAEMIWIGSWAAALVLAGFTVFSFMPYNTIKIPEPIQIKIWQLAPEGWGFFTKSPRDPEMLVYHIQKTQPQLINIASTFSLEYAFGLNRDGRSQGIEIDQIISELQIPKLWLPCKHDLKNCVQKAPSHRVSNTSHIKTICGDIAFVEQKPVPWAWKRLPRDVVMPMRVAHVEVLCAKS